MLPAVRVLGPGLAGICLRRKRRSSTRRSIGRACRRLHRLSERLHGRSRSVPSRPGTALVRADRSVRPWIATCRAESARQNPVSCPHLPRDARRYQRSDLLQASQRQVRFWSRHPKVRVITRPLRYPKTWPHGKAEENGIDVSLADDFVVMAIQGEYDVGILMSTDTDLRPALEAVLRLRAAHIEVSAWSSPQGNWRRLSIKSRRLWCHWLDRDNYARVRDRRDYSRP
ncbi:MAG: NYN domain-containing protein [Acidimicrobiia bacterium]|nr:NYN domain-containing protein [Acidimicrobiia bacterium]